MRCKWVSIKAQSKIRDLTSSLDGPSVWQRLSMGGAAVLAVPHDGFGTHMYANPVAVRASLQVDGTSSALSLSRVPSPIRSGAHLRAAEGTLSAGCWLKMPSC